jgi:hypothetical protein
MGKKTFTTSTSTILNKVQEPQVKEGTRTDRGEAPEVQRAGRPRNRRTSTSQQGLREGLTRMTFIVSQEKQDKLKFISYNERLSLREILDEAIDDYINKYEDLTGPIQLN